MKQFLERLVEAYRERERGLPDLAERPVQPAYCLSAPVQLVAIGVKEPAFTAIIKVHVPDRPDGEMFVYEEVERWDLWRTLEDVLALDLWRAPLRTSEEEEPSLGIFRERPGLTLRSVVQSTLEQIHHECRMLAMQEPKSEPDDWWPGRMDSLTGDGAVWVVYGDLEHLGLDRIVEDLVRYRIDPPLPPPEPTPDKPPRANRQRENPYPGHGGYHNPGIILGQTENWTLNELVVSRRAMPGGLVFEDTLGGFPFVGTHNGFLGVLTEDQGEAMRWLNLLGCAMLQDGVPTMSFRETEAGSFHDPRDRVNGRMMGWGGRWPSQQPEKWLAHWISDDQMRGYLRAAEALAKKPYAKHLPLLLEAHTHHTAGQPAQSLVFSWAIIEQQVVQRWDHFLAAKSVKGKRKKRLKQPDLWNISTITDTLDLAGELTEGLIQDVDRARRIRNDALHGKKFPTIEEAGHVLDTAEKLLIPHPDPPVRAPPRPQTSAGPVLWV